MRDDDDDDDEIADIFGLRRLFLIYATLLQRPRGEFSKAERRAATKPAAVYHLFMLGRRCKLLFVSNLAPPPPCHSPREM